MMRNGNMCRVIAVLMALLGMATLCAASGGVAAAPEYAVGREEFTVDFGDFGSKAEITYPQGVPGPFPTVLLIAGSGAYDRDFTIRDRATGQVKSAILRDIAESLTRRGYAVVRYTKHYLTDAANPQDTQAFYQKFTLPLLLDDADKVYAATRTRPQVDTSRLFIYGWSEGSTIGTQLALRHPEAAGLILHGPLAGTWRDGFRYQDSILAVGYLRDRADADKDGAVTLDELTAALKKYPGTVSGFAALVCLDLAAPPTMPKLDAMIDANGDGKLDIAGEVIPALDRFFAGFDQNPGPYGPQYAAGKALPTILDTVGGVRLPVLLLQGVSDANVQAEGAARIAATLAMAGVTDHTLKVYVGLGHSLGPATDAYDDDFRPIAAQPLNDLADWLDRHATGNNGGRGGAVLPTTGRPHPLTDAPWPIFAASATLLGAGLWLRRRNPRGSAAR